MDTKITASLISQYLHCPREGWLFYNNLKTEHTSETVKIGKIFHELRYDKNDENVEIELDGIKIDKLVGEYIEEFKKAKTELKSAEMQVLFYLWKLKQKGVSKKGIIKFKENKGNIIIELTDENEAELLVIKNEIGHLMSNSEMPPKLYNKSGTPSKKCKGCSYYEFCWI